MPATEKTSFTLTPETKAKIADLAQLWSSAGPLPKTQVVTEAIHRAWAAEVREVPPPKSKAKKKS